MSLSEFLEKGDTYVYAPLSKGDFIRILELQPGMGKDILRCKLTTEPFQEAEDTYEAISYAWGDFKTKDTSQILCNDAKLMIGESLADALQRFRYEKKPRRLWADAVCINQLDDIEKGHQVTLMGQIYERAKQVLIWLGSDSERYAKNCFTLISETVAYINDGFEHENINYLTHIIRRKPTKIDRICMSKERWGQVNIMLTLNWFKRVWVSFFLSKMDYFMFDLGLY
jgi:hypothetical protein